MTFDLTRWFRGKGSTAVADAPQVHEVSREEIVRIIDGLARKRLGLSAQQVLSAYRAGRLEMSTAVTDLLVYSDLLPADDPIFESPRAEAPETRYALR